MTDESRHRADFSRARMRALGDRELVLAMRRHDALAFEEFVSRFHPFLLERARGVNVRGTERDELVFELLADCAMRLASSRAPVPRSLAGYLVAALRHRIANGARNAARLATRRAQAVSELDGVGERAVLTVCSESSIRASRGETSGGDDGVPRALARLAAAIERDLSDDDRALAGWLAEYIPHREIAAWLGISHDAAHKRVRRLRARLRDAALRHIASEPAAGRLELEHLLRRAGVPAARAAPPASPEESDHA